MRLLFGDMAANGADRYGENNSVFSVFSPLLLFLPYGGAYFF
jgi:hypothetical protein